MSLVSRLIPLRTRDFESRTSRLVPGASLVLISLLCLAPLSFAQQKNDIDAVKKRAELNSAKADLEEARKKRDMAVAARWKDREAANQERELFNERYQESKEKVDALMSERARLFEDVRVAREDLAQIKQQAETARSEFLSLAVGPERLETLAKFQEQGVPFKLPERTEAMNKVKKEMGLYRDDPLRIARSVFAVPSPNSILRVKSATRRPNSCSVPPWPRVTACASAASMPCRWRPSRISTDSTRRH